MSWQTSLSSPRRPCDPVSPRRRSGRRCRIGPCSIFRWHRLVVRQFSSAHTVRGNQIEITAQALQPHQEPHQACGHQYKQRPTRSDAPESATLPVRPHRLLESQAESDQQIRTLACISPHGADGDDGTAVSDVPSSSSTAGGLPTTSTLRSWLSPAWACAPRIRPAPNPARAPVREHVDRCRDRSGPSEHRGNQRSASRRRSVLRSPSLHPSPPVALADLLRTHRPPLPSNRAT